MHEASDPPPLGWEHLAKSRRFAAWRYARQQKVPWRRIPDPEKDLCNEVISSYLPAMVDAAESVRSHAATGYTVASAVAASLIAGGVLGGVADASTPVQIVAAAALAAWLVAAVLFMHALADEPVYDLPERHVDSPQDFVKVALGRVGNDRWLSAQRSARAKWGTALAIVLTFVAVVVALTDRSDAVAGVVTLSSSGQAEVGALCGRSSGSIRGRLDPQSLGSDYTAVALMDRAKTCPKAAGSVLHLRKSAIVGMVSD